MEEKTSITLSLPISEKEKWQKFAEEKDMSLSAFIRRGMSAYIYALNSKKKQAKSRRIGVQDSGAVAHNF